MKARILGGLVSVLAVAAVLSPLGRDPARGDSFPLSTYPMFARARTSPVMTLEYLVGIDAAGSRHYIPPRLVANQEVLQARARIRQAVGSGGAAELCAEVASRLGGDGDLDAVTELRVVRGTHDAVGFLVDESLGQEQIVARCEVPR